MLSDQSNDEGQGIYSDDSNDEKRESFLSAGRISKNYDEKREQELADRQKSIKSNIIPSHQPEDKEIVNQQPQNQELNDCQHQKFNNQNSQNQFKKYLPQEQIGEQIKLPNQTQNKSQLLRQTQNIDQFRVQNADAQTKYKNVSTDGNLITQNSFAQNQYHDITNTANHNNPSQNEHNLQFNHPANLQSNFQYQKSTDEIKIQSNCQALKNDQVMDKQQKQYKPKQQIHLKQQNVKFQYQQTINQIKGQNQKMKMQNINDEDQNISKHKIIQQGTKQQQIDSSLQPRQQHSQQFNTEKSKQINQNSEIKISQTSQFQNQIIRVVPISKTSQLNLHKQEDCKKKLFESNTKQKIQPMKNQKSIIQNKLILPNQQELKNNAEQIQKQNKKQKSPLNKIPLPLSNPKSKKQEQSSSSSTEVCKCIIM